MIKQKHPLIFKICNYGSIRSSAIIRVAWYILFCTPLHCIQPKKKIFNMSNRLFFVRDILIQSTNNNHLIYNNLMYRITLSHVRYDLINLINKM